eukprot:m.34342 g.34342  ORF g.34342 m.34342 type:complete len:122 (+) comp11139_c0_seq1:293-658(+)
MTSNKPMSRFANDRQALLGGGRARISADRTDDLYEQENDQLASNLANQVAQLKSLTIDIGTEVKSQNKYLDEMDSDFDNTGGLLGNSMKRLKGLSKNGQTRFMLYMTGFVFFVFFLIYTMM